MGFYIQIRFHLKIKKKLKKMVNMASFCKRESRLNMWRLINISFKGEARVTLFISPK